jgi:hypothetical protein
MWYTYLLYDVYKEILEQFSCIDSLLKLNDLFLCFFRLQINISRIFTWSNWLRMIYVMMSVACILGFFWLPLLDKIAVDRFNSLAAMNDSSMIYTRYQRAYLGKYFQWISLRIKSMNSSKTRLILAIDHVLYRLGKTVRWNI